MRRMIALILLAGTAPAIAQPKPPVPDDDKVICKRQVETGSLVRAKKTCMTRRDWRDQMLSAQDDARRANMPINTQAPQ